MEDDTQGRKDAAASNPEQPVARTKHTELTLDQIGGLMPGLGGLMPIISDRFGWSYHAAKGGNWDLARYQLRKVRKLFGVGKTTRPKWIATIDAYDAGFLQPMMEALEARAWEDFEAATQAAVDEANRIHVDIGYGYIVYKLPEAGPPHMSVDAPD